MRLVKAWTTIDRLSIIWKSNLANKIKWDFFQAMAVSIWMHLMDVDKRYSKKTRGELHKNSTCCIKQILEATPHETTAV